MSVIRERRACVEAEVRRSDDVVVLQWTRDSAYRFFPLVEHPDFGSSMLEPAVPSALRKTPRLLQAIGETFGRTAASVL